MDKQIKEFCGIIGVYNHPVASEMAYLGLYSLQHRGQEGAGIVSTDGNKIFSHLGRGVVNEVFSKKENISRLKGNIAIGHNRYSTTGSNQKENVQPIIVTTKGGPLALGHNGNLVNSKIIRDDLQNKGAIFQTSTDSEVIVHLIARSTKNNRMDRIKEALKYVKGAFSLVILNKDSLIVARDSHGFRPLSLAKLNEGYAVASETCAFDLMGAKYIRDIEPGELLLIDKDGLHSEMHSTEKQRSHCIFEYIYFSRPDSAIFGDCVDKTRRKLGRQLAEEHPVDADIVIAVPDSSNTAALGYSNRSGVPFELGLIRNHYIGRTFIQPQQATRHFNVKLKFNPVAGVLKDKRVIVVEDSIVRGTTLKILTQLIKKAGAKEVHVRVSSPPICYPCYFGMDFPTKEELIASSKSVEEIRKHLEVDTLGYLSIEGLLSSVPMNGRGYCTACFEGNYPIPIEETFWKTQYEQ